MALEKDTYKALEDIVGTDNISVFYKGIFKGTLWAQA